jgi:Aminoglycoside-2''-adenylyltransferase
VSPASPDDAAFERWYGPWEPLTIAEVSDLLCDFAGVWWIVGGHAVEAFTGVRRPHEDIDIALFRRDLPGLRAVLADRYHTWSVGSGLLRPLNDDHPEMHREAGQVWIREHAQAPWVADFGVLDERDGGWVWKHDPNVAWSLQDSTWLNSDGVRFARAEIVLAHKARWRQQKDDRDFAAAWPGLDEAARRWLRDTVERMYPGHPWLGRMLGPTGVTRASPDRVGGDDENGPVRRRSSGSA